MPAKLSNASTLKYYRIQYFSRLFFFHIPELQLDDIALSNSRANSIRNVVR